MINFAVIGTNWITEKFVNGTLTDNDLKLTNYGNVAITSAEVEPTNASPFSVTFTFDEDVTGFVDGDITVGNGAASISVMSAVNQVPALPSNESQ